MSRAIKNATTKTSFEEFKNGNKLIFTYFKDQLGAFLIQNNRLTGVRFQTDDQQKLGAIYIGKVKNVVKHLNAAFVEIADKEICYLPFTEAQSPFLINRSYDGRLLEGDEVLVQITRAPLKTKQASVSCNIKLDNEYFVFSLLKEIKFSKKIEEHKVSELKAFVEDFKLDMGILFRTESANLEHDALMEHLNLFFHEWTTLFETAKHRTCFSCIRQNNSFCMDALDKHFLPEEYGEIITDDRPIYNDLSNWAKENGKKIRLYEDTSFPLSGLYALQPKLEEALNKRVWLKSGAYLVIEHTEALTTIDVNTGKIESNKDMSQVMFRVNMEAAEEIALQLKLRNLSGIIIVDFINCKDAEEKSTLLKALRELAKKDRIPTKVIDMTPLGLVEITRKKEMKPLKDQIQLSHRKEEKHV